MTVFEEIKNLLDKTSKKIIQTGEDLSKKAEEYGKSGLKYTEEKLSVLGETANDINNMIRHKMDSGAEQSELNLKYQGLGELCTILYKSKNRDKFADSFDTIIKQIAEIQQNITKKENSYQELKKKYTNNYEIKKLSTELEQGDVIIEYAVVAEKSNMANKQLKETLLPKEALISVVKREKEVIIPDGNTKLYSGDEVTVIGKKGDVKKIVKRLSSE